MENNKEKENPKIKIEVNEKTGIIVGYTPNIEDSVFAVHELASGLKVSMSNSNLLKDYNSALASQVKALELFSVTPSASNLLFAENKNFIENIIAPTAGTIAQVGLLSANSFKLAENNLISEGQLIMSHNFQNLVLDTIQDQQARFAGIASSVDLPNLKINLDSLSVSSRMINSGLTAAIEALPTFPSELKLANLEFIKASTEVSDQEISNHQEDLDLILKEINPKLVEYRKGVWEAFYREGNDNLGQAASSMRRLVDTLLRDLAPAEDVAKTKYFTQSPEAKDDQGRPNRKAKIFFIVKFDENKGEHLERLAKGFLEVYGNLPAWDHELSNKKAFIKGTFVAIEGYLIAMLSQN